MEITLSWMMTQYDKENTGYAQWKPEWAPAGLKITKLQETKVMQRGPYLRKEMLGMAMIEQTIRVQGKFSVDMDLKAFPMDHHNLQIEILFPDQNCLVQPNPSKSSFFRVSNISTKEFRFSQPAIEFGYQTEKEFSKDVRKLPQIKVSLIAHR